MPVIRDGHLVSSYDTLTIPFASGGKTVRINSLLVKLHNPYYSLTLAEGSHQTTFFSFQECIDSISRDDSRVIFDGYFIPAIAAPKYSLAGVVNGLWGVFPDTIENPFINRFLTSEQAFIYAYVDPKPMVISYAIDYSLLDPDEVDILDILSQSQK
jgi:hypothetical protein